MTRRTNNNPIGENWVKKETVVERKMSAKEALQKAKLYESLHTYVTERVDGRTVRLKMVK